MDGSWWVMAKEYENVLRLNCGDGCSSVNILKATEILTVDG